MRQVRWRLPAGAAWRLPGGAAWRLRGGAAWRLWAVAGCLLLLGAAALLVALRGTPSGPGDAAAGARGGLPAGGLAAAELTELFQRYGDTSGRWSGADRTASVALPDGRLLWLFSDTFLGGVNADRSRPRTAPFINNSAVFQAGRTLGPTVHGGTPAAPTALVPTRADGEFYWVGDASVHGDGADAVLQVLYNRYRRTGAGNLDFALMGTALASFALPDLRLLDVAPLPVGERVAWGSAILADGGYTYVYGSEAVGELKFGHLARVRGTDLSGPWEFASGGGSGGGSGWSVAALESRRLLSGVGTAFGVHRVDGRYVLVTHENNLLFSADVVAYTAKTPAGPFEGPNYLFQAPGVGGGKIIYDAHLHPELARAGTLLLSYNVNHLDSAQTYADASIYRPRFVEVPWPPAEVDPALLPAAPTGLTAAVAGAGEVALSWQPPGGSGLSYRVHRRDVTAGQTHFVRLPSQGDAPRFTADFLVNGHVYEFRVTAVNAAGEGRPSSVATTTAVVPPPPAPGGVRAVPGSSGEILVSWSGHPLATEHRVYYRDLTRGQQGRTLVGTFAAGAGPRAPSPRALSPRVGPPPAPPGSGHCAMATATRSPW